MTRAIALLNGASVTENHDLMIHYTVYATDGVNSTSNAGGQSRYL